MTSFATPNDLTYAQFNQDSTPLQRSLMHHYRAGDRGRNVFILNSGVVTENPPDGTIVTWDDVAHAFWGGHAAETITAAEDALLTAAGYSTTP